MTLSPGQAPDAPAGEELLGRLLEVEQIQACAADRAHDTDSIRSLLRQSGKEAVIPPKANRKNQFSYNKSKYKQRNRVERLIGRLKQFRAIATRYDKLASMFLALITLSLLFIRL